MHTDTKSLFIQIFLIIVFCTHSNAQNLITNPGFEDGISEWAKNMNNGSSANYIIETSNSPEVNNHLKCEVKKLGTNDWNLQIRSNGFAADETQKLQKK